MDDRQFWLMIREALLGAVKAIELYKLRLKVTTADKCKFYKEQTRKIV